jgi:mannose-6-phosphate isomerase
MTVTCIAESCQGRVRPRLPDRGIMNDMHRDAAAGPWLLEPARRRYAWGSTNLLQGLLDEPSDGEPLAELWFGTHPAGSATVPARSGASLVELVDADPDGVLGGAANRWSGDLPFMVKLIAADQPLSIQVHPDATRAAEEFAAENERGLAADDPARRYQDAGAKPEIVCALGEFDALIDFRPLDEAIDHLTATGLHDIARVLEAGGYAEGVRHVLAADKAATARSIDALVGSGDELAATLADNYPGDPGVIVASFLNRVRLAPGDAAFLAPGSVHAYLRGLAVEVMATSDNVLRAGLTSKLVDVEEFLRVGRLEAAAPDLLVVDDSGRFPARADEFALARFAAGDRRVVTGPAVVLCTAGAVALGGVEVPSGQGAFVPAAAHDVELSGSGEAYVATVGRPG